MPEPPETDGPVLVDGLAMGVCGTDIEISAGEYGEAPPWEQVERIGSHATWHPRRVLVTGAGPIRLLAALLAAQRGRRCTWPIQ